jgi:hypothetical protein
LTVTSFTVSGGTATADVEFTVSGPGKVVVSAIFSFDTPTNTVRGAAALAGSSPQTVSGSGKHTLTFTQTYDQRCSAARVIVSTSRGGSYEAKADCQVVEKTDG